jgi:hypothetical protein
MGLYTKNNHAGICQQYATTCMLADFSACHLLSRWFISRLFDHEYEGDILIRNVG